MANINPAKFVREVRDEANKVVWPTRKEIGVSTLMVLALATIASLFFVLVDTVISAVVRLIIGI